MEMEVSGEESETTGILQKEALQPILGNREENFVSEKSVAGT